jgi:glycosyltransferase involved in cell wall biosynthesis
MLNNKITIVIPTYGRFEPFKKLINSIKESDISKENYEIIVVSSDSQDSEKIKWIENQIKKIDIKIKTESDRKTIRNRSLYYYENIGIKNAIYDWILICNDDMWFEKDWYKKFLSYMNESKVYLISSHIGSIYLGMRIPSIGKIKVNGIQQPMWLYDMSIIHKSIYEKIGLLDENMKWYGKGADLSLSIAFFTNEKPVLCHDVKINHDIIEENRSSNIGNSSGDLDFSYIRSKWDKILIDKQNNNYEWI